MTRRYRTMVAAALAASLLAVPGTASADPSAGPSSSEPRHEPSASQSPDEPSPSHPDEPSPSDSDSASPSESPSERPPSPSDPSGKPRPGKPKPDKPGPDKPGPAKPKPSSGPSGAPAEPLPWLRLPRGANLDTARLHLIHERIVYLHETIDRSGHDADQLIGDLVGLADTIGATLAEADARWGLPATGADPASLLQGVAARGDLPDTDRREAAELAALVGGLAADMRVRQEAATVVTGAVDGADEEIERLEDEAATLRGEIERPRRGSLQAPVAGPVLSGHGARHDPYYHRWQVHEGIDIAAPPGRTVHAAAAGTVVYAAENGGYGLLTCIDHGSIDGQSVWTCYAHQSRLDVHKGQRIDAGAAIGLVGSTGASTGPHLHFEVRVNGGSVDPLPWLAADH
ncbi:peptidoglycan DD-metalloendopeptidase family protein [Phytomonospora sp. NPDC050363]|uniref:peptidoglycan DD-metalloendopeptidase family protein n=1 Tax=Phytomonospora sp. NPDC050363 TaxID=3155642 RepID=UPI0033D0FF3C